MTEPAAIPSKRRRAFLVAGEASAMPHKTPNVALVVLLLIDVAQILS